MKTIVLKRCLITAVALMAVCNLVVADDLVHYSCFSGCIEQTRAASSSDIAYGDRGWDASRTYRQLVVLVSFADCNFSLEDARVTYDAMFNTPGYTRRQGAGCVADYFRDQSDGLLNLQFDVYGPYQTSGSVKTGSSKRNEGRSAFRDATRMLMEEYPDIDYSLYDWNGDGDVEHVVYVYAGYSGNQSSIVDMGYIWPTTGYFSKIETKDGHRISRYSASGELWINNASCGIGTICHEFSHCLGLPDVYPISSSTGETSVVGEWDLMDIGTATNYGWCPPNYSPLEKMIMGWLKPTELTADTTITDVRPVAWGGEAYLIRQSDEEFYLLENRQWNGWDYGLPGQGLVVYQVHFNTSSWRTNAVNNITGDPNYCLVTADGRTFTDWYNEIIQRSSRNPYVDIPRRLHSRILSTAPFPCLTKEPVVDQVILSDEKSVTDITQHDDGTVSFTFHISGSGIRTVKAMPKARGVYTLSGQKVNKSYRGIIIKDGQKTINK